MPRSALIPGLKVVTVKGRRYIYFRGLDATGAPELVRLPDPASPDFGTALSRARATRTRRERLADSVKVRDAITAYERNPRFLKLASNSQDTYSVYLRRLTDLIGDAPVADVRRGDIIKMLEDASDRPQAATMLLTVARNVFTYAERRDWTVKNPCDGVEGFEGGEYEPWPQELVEAALMDADVRLAVALLYFTAQRIGDVCRMRWNDIKGGRIAVTQQKTGKELSIPVHSRLSAILADTPKVAMTILYGPRGRPAKADTVRTHLQAFAAARGCKIVPHGLRKNAVNALLEAGCSGGQVSSISGQSLRLVEHYAKRRDNEKLSNAGMHIWEGNAG